MTGPDAKPLDAVALVPARSGSVRIPGKNVRALAGHPLLAYAIATARASGLFRDVVVSTDDETYAAIARHYGASVPLLRPAEYASATSPDIEWVRHLFEHFAAGEKDYACFSILRPTSPFRRAGTIRRAFDLFLAQEGVDSLRAVEPVRQHPGKMWVVRGDRMTPLMPLSHADGIPWHSSQTASLPRIHVQNASLEIAWSRVVTEGGSIAGSVQVPFLTDATEGFDLNDPDDWREAERMVAEDSSILPCIDRPAFFGPDAGS